MVGKNKKNLRRQSQRRLTTPPNRKPKPPRVNLIAPTPKIDKIPPLKSKDFVSRSNQFANIRLRLGIGDILLLRAFTGELEKQQKGQINLIVDNNLLKKYINASGDFHYIDFIFKLLTRLFPMDQYSLTLTGFSKAPLISLKNMVEVQRIIPERFDYPQCILLPSNQLHQNLIQDSYVVITTKVRGVKFKEFESISDSFISSITKLANSKKIVLLGEKKLESRPEYLMHQTDDIYCIYDYLKKRLKHIWDKIVDLTEDIGILNYDRFCTDCLIQNKADAVISIGIGGNFCISACFAKKTINYNSTARRYRNGENTFGSYMYLYTVFPHGNGSNVCMTDDGFEFAQWINDL